MVTLTSADNALKSVYLGVVANQLNVNSNPLLGKIKQSTQDVWGKEIIKLAPYGINGGIGAGNETDELPKAAGNNYAQFKTTLKNLYGRIELSDKAIRASNNSTGAFVNLLNDEMEGLIKASSFNFGRMLYGDGSGLLATVVSVSGTVVTCNSVKNMIEGMVVDFYNESAKINVASGYRITYVDRVNKTITLNFTSTQAESLAENHTIYLQNSKGYEITGLGAIFDSSANSLYGLSKAEHPWLKPFISTTASEISDNLIQGAIDYIEEASGSNINYIACASGVRRCYQEYLGAYRRNIDIMELAGGYKAITYNGIPVVADRFAPDGCMYLLNTDDFVLHQLCDWKWLEGEDGRVLKQNAGYPTYSATLVKYADLICDRPCGQALIKNISSTVTNPFIPTVNVTNEITTGSEPTA